MEDKLLELIISLIVAGATFLFGYLKNNPKYQKGKKLVETIVNSTKDDDVNETEAKEILNHIVGLKKKK